MAQRLCQSLQERVRATSGRRSKKQRRMLHLSFSSMKLIPLHPRERRPTVKWSVALFHSY
uniref:Uncharacterized protein n=1 Tax=Arundo donax TaxID=35708 RepID=A0A0A9GCG1_ARUDO